MGHAKKRACNPLLHSQTLRTPETSRPPREYESGATSAARTDRLGFDSSVKKNNKRRGEKVVAGGVAVDRRHSRNRTLNSTYSSTINPMKSPEATELFSRYKNATTKPFCARRASIKDLYELHKTLSRDLTKTKKLLKLTNQSEQQYQQPGAR